MQGTICLLPRGTIQHPIPRCSLREQRFNATPYFGIRFGQQRLTLFAGFFQRGVIQILYFLPIFAVRLETPRDQGRYYRQIRATLNQKYKKATSGAVRKAGNNGGGRDSILGLPRRLTRGCPLPLLQFRPVTKDTNYRAGVSQSPGLRRTISAKPAP